MIERTVYTLALVAATSMAANVATVAALVKERTPSPVTYALVSQAPSGDTYVHDTGMTPADCKQRPDMGHPVQWCEQEAPAGMLIGFDCVGAAGPLYVRSESDLPLCGYIVRSMAR